MNTKLTLRLDEKLIASAKRHSAESGKSVSKCHTCADELTADHAGTQRQCRRRRASPAAQAGVRAEPRGSGCIGHA